MKKAAVLTLLFLFVFSSVCLAFKIDPDKWVWVGSNSGYQWFYDKENRHYEDYGRTGFIWVMMVDADPQKNGYIKSRIRFNTHNKYTFTVLSSGRYTAEGQEVASAPITPGGEVLPMEPESVEEKIYDAVFSLQPPADRWIPIPPADNDENEPLFFDKRTISYDSNSCIVFVKSTTSQGTYSIELLKLRKEDRTITHFFQRTYDCNTKEMISSDISATLEFKPILPNSREDRIYRTVFPQQ